MRPIHPLLLNASSEENPLNRGYQYDRHVKQDDDVRGYSLYHRISLVSRLFLLLQFLEFPETILATLWINFIFPWFYYVFLLNINSGALIGVP